MNTYTQGQTVRLTCTFRNDAAESSAPTTVALDVKPPNQPIRHYDYDPDATNPPLSSLSEGVYSIVVTADIPGVWKAVWHGESETSSPTAVSYFSVRSA